MIDTTADSVQEVTSKLNGAQASQHAPLNSTDSASVNKLGSSESPQKGPFSDITPDEASMNPIQVPMDSVNRLPPYVESPVAPIQITTNSVNNSPQLDISSPVINVNPVQITPGSTQLNLPSAPLNLPAPLNVSTMGTPFDNLEYDSPLPSVPGSIQQQNNQSASTGNATSVSIQPEPEDNDEEITSGSQALIYTSGSGIEISGDDNKDSTADSISGEDSEENSVEASISGDDDEEGISGEIPGAETAEDFVEASNETAGEKPKDHQQATSSPANDPPKYPYNTTNSYPYIMPQQYQAVQPGNSPYLARKVPMYTQQMPSTSKQTFYKNPPASNQFSPYSNTYSRLYSQSNLPYYRPPKGRAGKRRRRSLEDVSYQREGRPRNIRKGRSIEDVLMQSDDKNILFSNPFWDIHYDHNTLQVRSEINRPKVYHKTLNNMINKRWLIPGKTLHRF